MAARALSNYQALVKEIKGGQVAPLYLLTGDEQVLAWYIVSVLQEQLMPANLVSLNYQRLDGQKLTEAELLQAVETPPMFGDRRLVVIDQPAFVRGKSDGGGDRLTRLVTDWPPYTCGVLLCPELDKRLKLVKQLLQVARVCELPPLSPVEAAQWVDERLQKAGVRSRGLGRQVVERAGIGLQVLRLEVDKLLAYADGGQLDSADVAALVRNNLATSIFDLVDAVGHRQLPRALQLLTGVQAEGQEALYVLAMISRQLRLLLQARSALDQGLSQQQAAAGLGIHPFPAGKCVAQAQGWTASDLRQALQNCLNVDEAIKTGQLPDDRALEWLLLQLVRSR